MASRIGRRAVLAGAGALALRPHLRSAWAAEAPVPIGVSLPLSGPNQIVGAKIKIGIDVATERVNAEGGIHGRPIELVALDDRGDANQAVAILHELAGKDIRLIVGGALTSQILACVPLLDSTGVVFQSVSSPAMALTHELFNRRLFCDIENNYIRMRAYANFITERFPQVTAWSGAVSDNASGTEIWELFTYNLKQFHRDKAHNDVALVDILRAPYGTTDFRSIIAKIAASPAEGLITSLLGSDGVSFYQQMRAYNLHNKITVFADNALQSGLPSALKKNMPGNVWSLTQWAYTAFDKLPEAQAVAKATQQGGETYPYDLAALGNTAVRAFAAALQATGGSTDPDKVIAAMETVTFDTARGTNHFRKEDHQVVASMNIINFAADDSPQGWGVKEAITLPDTDNLNPPTPGVAFKL